MYIIKIVQVLSIEEDCDAMIWGSFCTTKLLTEYMRLCFIQHPQVSYIIALTSLQHEGKSVNEAMAALQNEKKAITIHTTQITTLKNDFKALENDNASLK